MVFRVSRINNTFASGAAEVQNKTMRHEMILEIVT